MAPKTFHTDKLISFAAIFILGVISSTHGGSLRNKRHLGYVQVDSFVPTSKLKKEIITK